MAVVNLRRIGTIVASGLAVAFLATSCSNANSNSTTTSSNSAAPGVTKNSITVGMVASISGAFSEGFGNMVYGERAYFDMINAEGGVDGRKILLPSSNILDDNTSSDTDADDIRTLVTQDHVFAITGINSAAFASAAYIGQEGTPTFGYNVSGGWEGPKNLFAVNGPVLNYSGAVPGLAYTAKQLNVKSVAVIAYPFEAVSKDACAAVVQGLTQDGIHVGFQDLNLSFDEDPTTDVQKMAAAHVDMLYSCTDGPENLKFVQTMGQYGLSDAYTIWDNGYDTAFITSQDTVQPAYKSLLSHSIFFLQHVPFQAASLYPNTYPGIVQYVKVMKHYYPAYVYDDNTYWGWASAAAFVSGLKGVAASGKQLNQGNLVDAVNAEAGFNAGVTLDPILPTWEAAHTISNPPYCGASVQVQPDGTLKPINVQPGNQTLVCFNSSTTSTPAKPLPKYVPPNP
jgi:branched-chain amino acid transport system substrate-binding protein